MSYPVSDWIEYYAAGAPDKIAMREIPSGRNFTYAQMHERVARCAGMLRAKGIERGDRVAYLTLNSTDTMELIFACWRIGAIAVALNFRLTPPELKFILENSETSLCLVDSPFTAIKDALAGNCCVKHWVLTGGMGGESEYETGLAAADTVYEMVEQKLEDQCLLMYSSGTTGTPKGVIITHGMMYFSIASGVSATGTTSDNVSLSNMPLFHIGGLNVTAIPAIWYGSTTVIMRMFDPKMTLDAIDDSDLGVTTLFMVPAAYNALKAMPNVEEIDFSRLKIALCGAEAVPVALCEWWMGKNVIIQEGYGMTETAAVGSLLTKEHIPHRVGSAGKSGMHSRIRIVDEGGKDCAPNVPGEIWFKGAAITPGYWRRPDANAESFVDGWFRSGDIGRMDEEGFLYIEDRVKDMYISGGENVYPAEVENVLYQMPQIVEVAVIGVPCEKFGETGCVYAAVKADAVLELSEVQSHVTAQLAKFKHPSHLRIVKALPRTASGKVQKFILRDQFSQG
ncbi:MAG: long-chain fatty acid--CoA ligase [Hellea sp.]|nr:long-chain fatty acid--CoA ligase [Hellea sp.]